MMVPKRLLIARLIAAARGMPRPGTAGALWALTLAILSAALASAQDLPPPRAMDMIPPAQLQREIAWKPTWDETLKANLQPGWDQPAPPGDYPVPAKSVIASLQNVALLSAMIARFPAEKDKHALAYGQMADIYHRMGSAWWRNYYLGKLIVEFPARGDVVAPACQNLSMASPRGRFESSAVFEPVARQAVALIERGAIPADHAGAAAACNMLGEILLTDMRYDALDPFLKQMQRLGPKCPGAAAAAAKLLASVGHAKLAADLQPQAPANAWDPEAPQPRTRSALPPLPRDTPLHMRWQSLRNISVKEPLKDSDIELIQDLLDTAARGDELIPADKNTFTACSAAADEFLTRLEDSALATLAQSQQRSAANFARSLMLTRDRDEMVRLGRRFPWAPVVHETLLDFAEEALRDGHRQWAMAAYADVLAHSRDRRLRVQAQAGAWLTQSQEACTPATAAAVPDEAQLTWRGAAATLGDVKKAIFGPGGTGFPACDAQPGKAVPPVRLALPAAWMAAEAPQEGPPPMHVPWPVAQVHVGRQYVIAATHNRATGFASGGDQPLWVVSPLAPWQFPERTAAKPQAAVAPPPPSPPVPDGPVSLLRKGDNWWIEFQCQPIAIAAGAAPSPAIGLFRHKGADVLAAVEPRSGKVIWSSAALEGWNALRPISQPTLAEGRGYLLAAGPDGEQVRLLLTCFEPGSGSIVWQRLLGTTSADLLDSAVGAGPGVFQGRVYCCTNLGIVACCDARDGAVQWLCAYDSAWQDVRPPRQAVQITRQGPAPIIAGSAVVMAPRDHTGLLAFNRLSGQMLWQSPLVPSDGIIGAVGGRVLAINNHWLAAVEAATGRLLWCRRFDEGTGSAGTIVRDAAVIISARRLLRIEPAGGKTIDAAELPDDATQAVVLGDGSVLEIAPPVIAAPPPAAWTPATAAAPGGVEIKKLWSLPLGRSRLLLADDETAPQRFGVQSGRWLGGVEIAPAAKLAWQRTLDRLPSGVESIGGRLIARTGAEVAAFDAASGRRQWTTRLSFPPYFLAGQGDVLVADSAPGRWELNAAAIDARSGKLLWTRSFDDALRLFRSWNSQGLAVRRGADGAPAVSLYMLAGMLDENPNGFLLGEVRVGAADGAIQEISAALPGEREAPAWTAFRGSAIGYLIGGREASMAVIGPDGLARKAQWNLRTDIGTAQAYPWFLRMQADASWACFSEFGKLALIDVATGKSAAYEVPAGPAGSLTSVYATRVIGDVLVVVAGHKAQFIYRKQRKTPDERWQPIEPKVFVHLFNRTTRECFISREVAGVECGRSWEVDWDMQARILDNALVVADCNGVHLFAAAWPQVPPPAAPK
ncbi:MAG: PQQ-binding-like beta-propeller repeat protein [Planctomycetaceae bacterium]|nr:PQQ-like beta-propeller repeat protein [Planctomycetaceae bacterium]